MWCSTNIFLVEHNEPTTKSINQIFILPWNEKLSASSTQFVTSTLANLVADISANIITTIKTMYSGIDATVFRGSIVRLFAATKILCIYMKSISIFKTKRTIECLPHTDDLCLEGYRSHSNQILESLKCNTFIFIYAALENMSETNWNFHCLIVHDRRLKVSLNFVQHRKFQINFLIPKARCAAFAVAATELCHRRRMHRFIHLLLIIIQLNGAAVVALLQLLHISFDYKIVFRAIASHFIVLSLSLHMMFNK